MKKFIVSILSFGLSLSITAGLMPPPVMAGTWETYLDSENLRTYYDALPESDRKDISAKMSGQNFSDADAFIESYSAAFDSVVMLNSSGDFEKITDEDFENGIGSEWHKNGSPMTDEYYYDYTSLSYDGTDAQGYFVFGGAMGYRNTWIEKNFGEREAIKVSLYFYDTLSEMRNSAFGVQVSDGLTFGVYKTASEYGINNGNAWSGTGIEREEGWHRIVFDAQGTKLNAYLDGTEIYSGTENVKYLKIGNLWSNNGNDMYIVDRVSVIGTKELTWEEKFNGTTVTTDVVKSLLEDDDLKLYEKLPQCDMEDIAAHMENSKPYSSRDDVMRGYKKALSSVTMYDEEKYGLVFHEGFKDGVSSAWKSEKKPAINQFIDVKVDNLDITGDEQNAAGFWGSGITANNGDGMVTGAFQNIERSVPENSTVAAYLYDPMNSETPFISFKINDSYAVGLYSYGEYVYTTDGGAGWKGFNLQRSKGWHKIVFDGSTVPGKITAYFDGIKLFTETASTDYIAIGDYYGSLSYDWFGVDNITVYRKFVPKAENVRVIDNKTHLSVSYDYSHNGSIAEGTPKYKWYRQNDDGNFEVISGADGKDYYFSMPEDSGKKFKASVTPYDKNGNAGDETMTEVFTESYMTGNMPNVTSVKIEGENVVGSTLKAVYTAENAGGIGAGEDRYKWYMSEDGTAYKEIEGAVSSTYRIGVEAVRASIKCEVSVAGKDGTYSFWTKSDNVVSDNSSVVQMINAVQAVRETGRNALMLKLLAKCDPMFASYPIESQRKIAVAAITSSVVTESDYNKIVKGVLDGSLNVDVSEIDFIDKPSVSTGESGGAMTDISFMDLETVPWAKQAIVILCQKGITEGYSNTVFAPNERITRAQFITMLVRAFYMVNPVAENTFRDVDNGAWYKQFIATAAQNGLVKGRADGTFGPDEPITREEMAIFCARVLESGKCYLDDVKEYSVFADESDISEYAHDSVVSIVRKGVMSGMGDNMFNPRECTTRAMSAQVIYAMLGKPSAGSELASEDVVIEDFETGTTGIFENGYPDKSDVEKLKPGSTAYSGTGSVIFRGKAAAVTEAGNNRYFRIMFYDANGQTGGADGCLIVEGDKETYTIGTNTGKGAYNQGLYYQCRVGDKWYETGVIKSIGWHEFAIDMSESGKVDMYMDGLLVKSFTDEGTTPKRVVIGNLNDGTYGQYNCYGDDFVMAKSKAVFDVYMNANRPTGNILIGQNPVDISSLAEGTRNKAQLLNALAVLPVSEGGGADPSDYVTRAELAYLLSGMANESAYHRTAEKKYFSDVDTQNWTAGYIADAVQKGLLTAYNQSFKPDEPVECIDAINAVLKLLGYGTFADKTGDDGIVKTAMTVGVSDRVPTYGKLTWEAAIKLLSNMLESSVMEYEVKKSLPAFGQSDVLYMNYAFDLYKIKGVVNGTYGGEFKTDTDLEYDEMLIGTYKIKTNGKQVNNYLGADVKAYVHGDEESRIYTLLHISETGISKTIEIDGRDIDECKNNQLKYAVGSSQKTLKLSPKLKVIKNGSYLFDYGDSDFKFDIGNVKLTDTDGNGTYDCAVIKQYDPVKVAGYDLGSKVLHDSYTGKAYNFSDVEIATSRFDGRAYPESVAIGEIVLVAAAEDGKHADIIPSSETVQGTIKSVSAEDISIDGKEYKLSKAFADYVAKAGNGLLDIGSESVFAIDTFGNVVGILSSISGGSVYAYMIKSWLDESGESVWVKMYTDKGAFITLECDSKFIINDQSASPKALLEKSPQLVKYKLKGGDTLKRIDFADESHRRTKSEPGDGELKGSDKFWLYYSGDIQHWSWYQFGSIIDPTNNPVIMVIPPDGYEEDEKKYRLTSMSEFGNDKPYYIMAYDANEYNQVPIFVYQPSLSSGDKPDNKKDITQTRVFVVNKIIEQINDDGDPVQVIIGWEEGKKVSYEVDNEVDLNEYKKNVLGYNTDWKFGDCMIVGFNRDDKVIGAWCHEKTANSLNPDPEQRKLFVYSEGESVYSDFAPTYFSDFYAPEYTAFWFGKIKKNEKGLVIEGKDGAEFSTQRAWFNTIVVNRKEKTVVKGSSADLIPGRECYCFAYHGKPYELIVFVD